MTCRQAAARVLHGTNTKFQRIRTKPAPLTAYSSPQNLSMKSLYMPWRTMVGRGTWKSNAQPKMVSTRTISNVPLHFNVTYMHIDDTQHISMNQSNQYHQHGKLRRWVHGISSTDSNVASSNFEKVGISDDHDGTKQLSSPTEISEMDEEIIALATSGDVEEAQDLLDNYILKSNLDINVKLSMEAFTSLFDAWLNSSPHSLALPISDTKNDTLLASDMEDVDFYAMICAMERAENVLNSMEHFSSIMQNHHYNHNLSNDTNGITIRTATIAPTSYHYQNIIRAYHAVMKVFSSHDNLHTDKHKYLLRGIPQRATTYLERMEQSSKLDTSTGTTITTTMGQMPPPKIYNLVLETWELSRDEHNAAPIADSIFRRMIEGIEEGRNSHLDSEHSLHDDVFSARKILIRTWSGIGKRGDGRRVGGAAFRATGHLFAYMEDFGKRFSDEIELHGSIMQDQDAEENLSISEGVKNYQLTLEDYLMVLEAWVQGK